MRDSFIILADVSVPGLFEIICGISWTLLLLISGAVTIVAVGFCFLKRKAHLASRLGRVGIWTGAIATLIAIVATLATAKVELGRMSSDASPTIADAALTILMSGIIPVIAFIARRISCRTMRAAAAGGEIEPQKK